ncbi:MAG: KTSC domain-containing protein [Nevskiaceae bacterium]|nr:MAG: KTSC domain-containing protein [Nevskiaceae bacterium]
MLRTPVKSSQIASVGYDAGTKTLEIEFPSRKEAPHGGAAGPGSIYQYSGVPSEVHANLMGADSPGRFFGVHIRGKFAFKKMEPEAADA